MINKYPTIYEIQEVLNSPLITRGFINQFAQKRGVFLVNASKEDLIKELSYHLYEYTDLDEITIAKSKNSRPKNKMCH